MFVVFDQSQAAYFVKVDVGGEKIYAMRKENATKYDTEKEAGVAALDAGINHMAIQPA